MKNIINPNNKCGYESLWIALKCKKSSIIEKYYLSNMIDLYKLFKYGNDEYPSLFEHKNIKQFYKICPYNIKNNLNNFKYRLEKTDNGIVPPYYFALVSIYFNLKIIIVDKNKQILKESTSIKKILNNLGLNPIEGIELCYTPNHIEYIPEKNELLIFNILQEKINNIKILYKNIIYEKIIRDEIILTNLIF